MSLLHRDSFGRVLDVGPTLAGYEHYMRPHDGRLALLKVQGTNDLGTEWSPLLAGTYYYKPSLLDVLFCPRERV